MRHHRGYLQEMKRTWASLHLLWHILRLRLRHIAVLLQPFMTKSPNKIVDQLGLDERLLNWETLGDFNAIPTGTKVVEKGVPIFPRLDPEVEVDYIRDQMAVSAPDEEVEKPKQKSEPASEEITIDDFMKVDLRVATVIACEKIPKADKLLKASTRSRL